MIAKVKKVEPIIEYYNHNKAIGKFILENGKIVSIDFYERVSYNPTSVTHWDFAIKTTNTKLEAVGIEDFNAKIFCPDCSWIGNYGETKQDYYSGSYETYERCPKCNSAAVY